ncbi:ATP-binding protein [Fuerstiella marisgermanici]|uniref:HSP90 family protein n=1 Tax=Fuerstiella marisgermanici TaxID=1891926 RepID=A0A1P8WF24_9PLAN|nr:ATP-binding protein [Fuerstiella marisgermanici]APZ92643.1 HSP90 family protein [Fuerstiella marisgermanici]
MAKKKKLKKTTSKSAKEKATPPQKATKVSRPDSASVASASRTAILNAGSLARKIEVPLSYKIVSLFSEGLYQSANKAFEELVTNSFDAGATEVKILLPVDPTDDSALIAIADNGTGMDVDGLQDLWKIGTSGKRDLASTPKDRIQIGKFGIGKLSTYVLANEVSYICKRRVKRATKYFVVTMDYTILDTMADDIVPKEPMKLNVRELSAVEAKDALSWCLSDKMFTSGNFRLFGEKSSPSWTVSVLSRLKEKANEIQEKRLRWILSTALPLRDDFAIWLGGQQVKSSRETRGRIGKWVLGKDIKTLSRPAPDGIKVRKDNSAKADKAFGLYHSTFGRVTGYTEAFHDVLTGGKAEETGRSNGFFVYVRGRLVNIEDEYFGLDSNKLAHGTFSRFRVVVHVDSLDEELQSAREGVRDGPKRRAVQKLLQGIFNFTRKKVAERDVSETPGSQISEKLAGSPSSLTRRPLVAVANAVFEGKFEPAYTRFPSNISNKAQKEFISQLEDRESADDLISSVDYSMSLSPSDGIALYDIESCELWINGLHPFVGASADNFQSSKNNRPLQLLAMAEVLLEAQLFYSGVKPNAVKETMKQRDELLRYLGRSSGRRTSIVIAQDLKDARNDQDDLEDQLVACFESLGFEASKIGGSGNPDGLAHAHLSADEDGNPRSYSVSLEAKSKKTSSKTKTVSAKTVGVSTLARHRDMLSCEHSVVVGPEFPTTQGENSALAKEITADHENTGKTITLIRVNDFAKLVSLAPVKQLSPSQLKDLFDTCQLPDESADWIEKLTHRQIKKPPYKKILDVIWSEQINDKSALVKYSSVRILLRPIRKTDEEIKEICKSIMGMAPGFLVARDESVELEYPPSRVLEAIKTFTDEQEGID